MNTLYQYTLTDAVLRLSDGAVIPKIPGNVDFDEFTVYTEGGGICLPAAQIDPKDAARAALNALEQATMMNRGLREFLLVSMQDLAIRQSQQLLESDIHVSPQLILASNSAWLRLVEINTQATLLRAQL